MKKLVLFAAAAAVSFGLGTATKAAEEVAIPKSDWSFSGIFGSFDQAQLQRGFQVYKEVCSACHSLDLIAFRNLADLGYNEDELKAIASEYLVADGPNEDGDMFERDGRPSDYFPSPFPNVQAAAVANGGAAPPDLSLMAKARAAGPDYIKALMMGYEEPPANFELLAGSNYNAYFPGHQIAMAPPLSDDMVEYADGTPATLENLSADVSAFLMWAAEPALGQRKQTGVKVILFLLVFTAVLYAAKRKCWSDIH